MEVYLRYTPQGEFLRTARWGWPIFESLHFLGMSMLLGTVGVFDLRLLGFARRIPIAALHRLIPIGIAGFVINLITGFCFLSATPDQYLFNLAFRWKVTFITIAGLNVMVFYARVFRRLLELPPDTPPPLAARIAGGVSLLAWIGVMSAGRLLTFFRPEGRGLGPHAARCGDRTSARCGRRASREDPDNQSRIPEFKGGLALAGRRGNLRP